MAPEIHTRLPQPQIGYGSDKKTRNLLPNGFYKFSVSNVAELEMLMMHNRRLFVVSWAWVGWCVSRVVGWLLGWTAALPVFSHLVFYPQVLRRDCPQCQHQKEEGDRGARVTT